MDKTPVTDVMTRALSRVVGHRWPRRQGCRVWHPAPLVGLSSWHLARPHESQPQVGTPFPSPRREMRVIGTTGLLAGALESAGDEDTGANGGGARRRDVCSNQATGSAT
jgi:hypothetical protein